MTVILPSASGSAGTIKAWTGPGTDYREGQPAIYGGRTYTADDVHTSGATFDGDAAHWTPLPIAASDVAVTPAGGISSTTTQAAVVEAAADAAAAAEDAADAIDAVAATALGQLFGTEEGLPLSPWQPTPVMGDEYWSALHFQAGGGLNTSLTPSIIANATNQTLKTRCLYPNLANRELSWRIEFDYAITVPSGSTAQRASIAIANINIGTGNPPIGESYQTVVTSESPRKTGHFILDFVPKGADEALAFEVRLSIESGAPSGSVSISNATLRLTGGVSRPMLISKNVTGAHPVVFHQLYRPKTDDHYVSRMSFEADAELAISMSYVDAWARDNIFSLKYPDAAFLVAEGGSSVGVGNAGFIAGYVNLRASNNDQILHVETPTPGTYELRCNVHGGETIRGAASYALDRGAGLVSWPNDDGLLPVWRMQVNLPTHVKRSADAAGDYFANVDHLFTVFRDGMVRCDRTTTFLKATKIWTLFEWMSSHDLRGRFGRLGAGQSVIAEVDTYPKVATPAAPTLATATTGGVLADSTYSYRVAARSEYGESLASTAATVVAAGGGTSKNTVTWVAVANATAYALYGRLAGVERLLAVVGPSLTSWIDDGSLGGTTAPLAVSTARRSTGMVSDFKASSKATWGVFQEPDSGWCIGSIYDRDAVLARPGVAGIRVALGGAAVAIMKNYGIARFDNDDAVTVASGTVWTATHWSYVYRPQDNAEYHREIAARAASLEALKDLYPAT